MFVLWLVLAICFVVNTFHIWKLQYDFQEWATDINVEFPALSSDEVLNRRQRNGTVLDCRSLTRKGKK